jgi:PBP1b-binding outer membrane lipoprotein LpoB
MTATKMSLVRATIAGLAVWVLCACEVSTAPAAPTVSIPTPSVQTSNVQTTNLPTAPAGIDGQIAGDPASAVVVTVPCPTTPDQTFVKALR